MDEHTFTECSRARAAKYHRAARDHDGELACGVAQQHVSTPAREAPHSALLVDTLLITLRLLKLLFFLAVELIGVLAAKGTVLLTRSATLLNQRPLTVASLT